MLVKDGLFTSESVTMGHPDKVADQISDAVLDAVMEKDPFGRVACETMVAKGMVVLAGEITTKTVLDFQKIARDTLLDIGYDDVQKGMDAKSCAVVVSMNKQSPDIAMGVDREGAGDQGMMFGFAVNETRELMPLPIMLAQKLVMRLAYVREKNILKYLGPDGKSQVSVRYKNGKPVEIDAVVISNQHDPKLKISKIRKDILAKVIKPVLPKKMLTKRTKIHINPTGKFAVGGPEGDCGLTGRKIIVDTYGGMGRHGGGAFSGKDPSKVDRSAAYMARYIAKNIVAAKLAEKCEVQLSYAIGVAEPTSVLVDTFGTGKISEAKIEKLVRGNFKLTPKGIRDSLKLRKPIYRVTAAHGHFGRNGKNFTWEKTDKAAALRKGAGLKTGKK